MEPTSFHVDGLPHQDLRELYAYWLANGGRTGIPLRSTLDPVDFKHLLPRLAIIEVLKTADGDRFRYRLAGTEIARQAGRDPTGKTFDDLYEGEYLAAAMATYTRIVKTGRPDFSERTFPLGEGAAHLRYNRIILPYSSDGAEVDQLVLLIVVLDQTASPRRVGSFEVYSDAGRADDPR